MDANNSSHGLLIDILEVAGRERMLNLREHMFIVFAAKADVKVNANRVKKLRQKHR